MLGMIIFWIEDAKRHESVLFHAYKTSKIVNLRVF